jgi:hypothetical protein
MDGIRTPDAVMLNRLLTRSEWVGECLIYNGGKNGIGKRYGYGLLAVTTNEGKIRRLMAHRVAYQLQVGPIPEGLVLDHVRTRGCTSTACINVAHLEPVTRRVNSRRGDAMLQRTHCPKQHEFTEENTYVYVDKRERTIRYCRTCRREAQRRAYRKEINDELPA